MKQPVSYNFCLKVNIYNAKTFSKYESSTKLSLEGLVEFDTNHETGMTFDDIIRVTSCLAAAFVDGGKVDAGHLKFQKIINSDEIILLGLAQEKFLFSGDRTEGVEVTA